MIGDIGDGGLMLHFEYRWHLIIILHRKGSCYNLFQPHTMTYFSTVVGFASLLFRVIAVWRMVD